MGRLTDPAGINHGIDYSGGVQIHFVMFEDLDKQKSRDGRLTRVIANVGQVPKRLAEVRYGNGTIALLSNRYLDQVSVSVAVRAHYPHPSIDYPAGGVVP